MRAEAVRCRRHVRSGWTSCSAGGLTWPGWWAGWARRSPGASGSAGREELADNRQGDVDADHPCQRAESALDGGEAGLIGGEFLRCLVGEVGGTVGGEEGGAGCAEL